jgi:uroporphyrinogen decarboxylase
MKVLEAPMTALENFTLLISGKPAKWIPYTLNIGSEDGFTPALQKRFQEETGRADASEYFDFDLRTASVSRRPIPGASAGADEWGVHSWACGVEGLPESTSAPLASATDVKEIRDYPEPKLDAKAAGEAARGYRERGYPTIGFTGSIFVRACLLRGMEKFKEDLEKRPEMAAAVVEKVAGFTRRLALETAAAGVDILSFFDDAGTPRGMRISPSQWRSYIKPAWASVLQEVRRRHPGAVFFFHSCGNISEILPDIVELGFQILHPVPAELNPVAVKKQWGGKIVICATIGSQSTLSRATAEFVRRETSRIMDELGADRRCILCPSARILPETPFDNVLAFSAAARNHRFGKRKAGRED